MQPKAKHHVAVWMDHQEARVFRIESDSFDQAAPRAAVHHVKHNDRNAAEHEHPDDARRFFHDIARTVDAADEVLIVGPSTAKLQFLKYVHANDPALEKRIVGVETVDHPTDGQLAAFARHYFHADPARGHAP